MRTKFVCVAPKSVEDPKLTLKPYSCPSILVKFWVKIHKHSTCKTSKIHVDSM